MRLKTPATGRSVWTAAALSAFTLSVMTMGPAVHAQPQEQTQTQTQTPSDPRPEYRLGAGDALRILVYQSPDLTLEQRVQDDGRLTYPLLGALQAAGLTVRQLEERLEQGLRSGGFLRQPQVAIMVMQVRAHQASVLGQVQRPGRFAVDTPGMRLSDLLAQAGGITALGAERVIVTGQRQGQAWRQEIDLPALFASPFPQEDISIVGGDVVFVDRAPLVYVYGEVQRPGPVRLERGMTVLQALAAGGGPTLRGTTRGMRLTRHGAQGPLPPTSPSLVDALEPGDVLHVPQSLF